MNKKLVSLFTILSVILLFSSCEGPRGADGLDGRDGIQGPQGPAGEATGWKIINLNADAGKWVWDKDAELYYQEFEMPEITQFIADEGAVLASLNVNQNYFPLPYTSYFYDENAKMYISETINYDYTKGWLRVNVASLDLFDNTALNYQPSARKIKVTLIW